jgi:hypothetical protein
MALTFSRALSVLAGLALLLGACHGPVRPSSPVVSISLATQAAEALSMRAYAKAADLHRRALVLTPDSLPLHHGLAVAASHLSLKEEAIQQFRWVMERGPKGSLEVETARGWLVAAGLLAAPEPGEPAGLPAEERQPAAGQASLDGQMALTEPGGRDARVGQRRMVILYGLPDSPMKDERYQVWTDEKGRFRFPSVTSGTYMITDAVAGPRKWKLRIELQPGQATTLDLTPANTTTVRDDFPALG